jgi:hypothetical protein
MMKDRESELLGKIDNALRTSLQKVPFLEVVAMERSISAGDMRPDIDRRKPAYLASILVDTLKENGWTAEDIHFLGVEIINESGML